MAAGGSASAQAARHREHAQFLTRQLREAHRAAARWSAAAAGERQVAAALWALTGSGWTLLVDRRWPGTATANVDMILVGPAGVYVIDVKNWRDAPQIVNGELIAANRSCTSEAVKLQAVTRRVEDALAHMQMSPVAVAPVMVFVGRQVDERLGRVHLVGIHELLHTVTSARTRLRPPVVRAVAAYLTDVFPAYEAPLLPDTATTDAPASTRDEPGELFDVDDLAAEQLRAARERPVESWMTFLHPDQLSLVRRRWGGPARITGAAGTGKTVVGLHRAAYLAQSGGRVLYVTFVRNLPLIQKHLLERMAPAGSDRIEFTSLHRWAVTLLAQRGVAARLNVAKADDCFARAWRTRGRHTCLADLEPSPRYWEDELRHVIKGRDISSLPKYLAASRPGRRTALRKAHKEAVWALYEEYQRLLNERGVQDFPDLLLTALAELRRHPTDGGYTTVIADEVQDLTLTGVRILHAIAGDSPNGLLLIGDAQQAVYPGGFRLADAGINIRGGRAEVLHVNYRNAAAIMQVALNVLDGEPFDDIDGMTITAPPAVEMTYHDGRVVHSPADSRPMHDAALRKALNDLAAQSDDALADAAVLCATKRDVDHYLQMLKARGLPVLNLDDYDGRPGQVLKVGTYLRAKGLEFKYVYLPCHDRGLKAAQLGGSADIDRLALARRQLFVAMTRARDLLWLGSITDGAPATSMNGC